MQKPNCSARMSLLRALLLFVFALTAGFAVAGETPRKAESGTPAAAAKKDDSKETASSQDMVKALQSKISEQQAQIDKLMRAVELLTERLNATPANKAADTAELPHDTSVGQVSSLSPVIPAAASMEANAPASVAPATTASAVEDLKQKIDLQQKQIEKLQSYLNQQRLELDKRTGTAGDSQASQGEAQHVLLASNASPSPNSSTADPAQGSGSAGKAAPQMVQLPAALKAFHPIGLFYISYQAGRQYAGTPGETSAYNSFQLKRGYFGADVDVTSYLTARFVTDITSDSAGDFKTRMKYLYGKFHWKGNDAITAPYMEFGLAHMPWLDFEEAINGFRMQDTMFLERNGIFNSADVGVLFGSDIGGSMSSDYKKKVNSHYAGKFGSWQVGIYNGGGYHAAEKNKNKVVEGRISIRPAPSVVPGLQFSAFGVVGKGNVAMNPPDWKVFDGMVSYESERFTFTGQGFVGTGNQNGTAVNADGTSADQKGFSVFAAVHFPLPNDRGKISVIGRADEMNSNTAVYNDIKRTYIAGVAWHFYKSNTWLFDFQRTNHSFSSIPGENRVQATLQVGF